ncbi:MAG: penicillin-binding protein 2 [Eggerthellaceae bacterium]|nr:penicillin-binding protein 2 [Eggerthellaceae bacterium]
MLIAIVAAVVAALIVVIVMVAIAVVRSRRPSEPIASSADMPQLKNISPEISGSIDNKLKNDAGLHVPDNEPELKKPAQNLNRRYLAIGILSLGIFGALSAKLWSLQVLSSDSYTNKAEENLYTTVSTPAPRGYIYDTNGLVLARNRSSQTVLAEAEVADDKNVLKRLSVVLGIPQHVVRQRVEDTTLGAQSQRVVASDVDLMQVAYISEHASAFSGVTSETRAIREYPYGALAAHVIGYTGSVSEDSSYENGREIQATDTIGMSGIEYSYDDLIAGDHGQRKVMVDASGAVTEVVSETKPTKGSDIKLTIDARLQYLADTSLKELIAPYGTIGTGTGVAGAIVVYDPRDGSVLAMSSYPNYDPSHFTGGITTDIWNVYNPSDETSQSYSPMSNRCVNGLYAAASTYKGFTSLAGLQYGFAGDDIYVNCTGSWDGFGTGDVQHCWVHSGHGAINLYQGIVQSCDTVFYEIAKEFYTHGPEGTNEISETALQDFLERFRLGMTTGIDLAGESEGRIPTPEWKAEYFKNRPADAVWVGGDYTNMIIWQGDVLVTPLQIAVGYGAIATGNIMKPHLLKEVLNANGEVVITKEAELIQELDVDPDDLEYVRGALHGVIAEDASKSALFAAVDATCAGKSGTAEHSNRADDGWFVAYAPFEEPHYVVACIIEQGGGGSTCAAPIVADILAEAINAENGTCEIEPEPIEGWSGSYTTYASSSSSRTD